MRLGRRVLQRRARRKQRMVNYLISLDLLPQALSNNFGQEKLLNELGDPYELRTKGLDQQLEPHQFGRVLLHFVARRGFLSSKKQVAGDLVDDPDTQTYLFFSISLINSFGKSKYNCCVAQILYSSSLYMALSVRKCPPSCERLQ
jgi:CRISPR/Cas system Type II protein with McrA/HNH and RuvC-like nuclease domain